MPACIANDTLADHLKRQLAGWFGSIRGLSLLVAVAILAGMAGPFGTYEALAPVQRHIYWLLIVFGTAFAGHATGTAVEHALAKLGISAVPRLLVAALLAAVPVFGVVVLVLLVFSFRPDAADTLTLFLQSFAVVGGVTLATSPTARFCRARNERAQTPRLIMRLPVAKRGRLVRLQAQDHYVEVVTTQGQTLVPMRFRDAIAETLPEPGRQIHRSHWVARHAVSGRCRVSGRSGLRLSDGSFIPIGRKFRSEVLAGDLPSH